MFYTIGKIVITLLLILPDLLLFMRYKFICNHKGTNNLMILRYDDMYCISNFLFILFDCIGKEGKLMFQSFAPIEMHSEFLPDVSYFPFHVELYVGQESFVYRGFSLI